MSRKELREEARHDGLPYPGVVGEEKRERLAGRRCWTLDLEPRGVEGA